MHEDFDPAKHMICHRCYGTTYAHLYGKKLYPERPCKACKGKGFHDRNFPFAQWMSNTTTEFIFAPLRPLRTRSLVEEACPVCHGQRTDAYGRPCENCRGGGLVLADTNYHPKAHPLDNGERDDSHSHSAYRASTQMPIEGDSGADWPPLPAKTGSLTSASRSARRSGSGNRLSIIAIALIFVALLVTISMHFLGAPTATTQMNTVNTSGVGKPPDLPIIGGSETAFLAKYGLPLKSTVISGITIETLSNNISIAIYAANRSVSGIIVVADNNAGWSDDAAFTQCATFFPQDARLGQRHNVTDPHSVLDAWFRLGQSTLLASTLLQTEFADPNHSVAAGTFISEVYTDGLQAKVDNECSVKLSDIVVQPVNLDGSQPTVTSGTQVPGVPTTKPGVPSPILILAPTRAPVLAGPTPTQVPFDVPTPTVGPTQTPLPTATNTPSMPTDTPVPPTDTPVPPTDTPVPPTDTPTDTPTDVPTPGM